MDPSSRTRAWLPSVLILRSLWPQHIRYWVEFNLGRICESYIYTNFYIIKCACLTMLFKQYCIDYKSYSCLASINQCNTVLSSDLWLIDLNVTQPNVTSPKSAKCWDSCGSGFGSRSVRIPHTSVRNLVSVSGDKWQQSSGQVRRAGIVVSLLTNDVSCTSSSTYRSDVGNGRDTHQPYSHDLLPGMLLLNAELTISFYSTWQQ